MKPKYFKPTSVDQVLGCAGYKGKKKSLREMEQGIKEAAKKQLPTSRKFCQIGDAISPIDEKWDVEK